MTSRGPFRPKTFYDSMKREEGLGNNLLSRQGLLRHARCSSECDEGGWRTLLLLRLGSSVCWEHTSAPGQPPAVVLPGELRAHPPLQPPHRAPLHPTHVSRLDISSQRSSEVPEPLEQSWLTGLEKSPFWKTAQDLICTYWASGSKHFMCRINLSFFPW